MRHPAFRLTLLASTVAFALAAQAAPSAADRIAGTELIARDALFGNPERANVQISPDGKYLSWVAAVDGVLNVWIAPADNPSQARAVTQDTARGIRSYFWSYQPDTLLYLRDSGGDEDFHLYAVDLKTGQAKDLTPFPKTTAQVASTQAQEIREGTQLRAARWALEDRDANGALERLEDMPQGAARRTLALRIRLKATRQARKTREALETARLLGKHRAFSPDAAQSIVRSLATEWVGSAHDTVQLLQVWNSLEPAERAMPELAISAAQRLAALGGDPSQVRGWLLPVWERMLAQPDSLPDNQQLKLVQTLESALDGVDADWLARIESAQQRNPRDARLTYLAGAACVERQLWGKAQVLLAQAAQRLQDVPLRRNAWRALALLAERRDDATAAAEAWKNAALAS